MSYKNIDHKRFTYLLLHGLDPTSVLVFFKENRVSLIQAGVKVQNIPKLHREQITLIVSKFSDKAYNIFEKFVLNQLSGINVREVEKVISEFTHNEKTSILDNDVKDNCQSTLFHLFQEDTPAELLDFLKTRLDTHSIISKDIVEEIKKEVIPEYIPDLVSAAYGIFDDKNTRELPRHLIDFLKALSHINQGKKVDEIRVNLIDFPILSEALDKAELAKDIALTGKKLERGLKYFNREILSDIGTINVYELEVVAHCLNLSHDKEISFLEPIGLINNNSYIQLPKEQWEKLFPNIGQLIAFSDTAGLRLPNKGDFGVWRVEEYPTDRPIKSRLRKLSRHVFEVFPLGFSSDKFDEVRNAIKEFKTKTQNRPLFVLSDGIIIRLKYDVDNHSQDNFDEPLEAWLNLKAFKFGSRSFVMGPLPASDFSYDCSDIDKFLRNLVKFEQELKVIPQLTKLQTNNLLIALKDAAKNVDINRTNQLNTQLDRILRADDAVSKAIESILTHPKIVAEINLVKVVAEQTLYAEKNALVSEIEKLKELKNNLGKDLKRQESERARLPAELKKQTLVAFEEARNQGIKAWADSIVMTTLLEAFKESKPIETQYLSNLPSQKFQVNYMFQKEFNLEELMVRFGITRELARGIKLSIDVARNAGLGIVFCGASASFLARAYAQTICSKGVCILNVPVGWINSDQINACLEEMDKWDVILLNNYNLSVIEAYGSQLISTIEDGMIEKSSLRPHVIATHTNSVAALPRSHSFESLSLVIDLDKKSYPGENSIELFQDLLEEANQTIVANKLPWKVTAQCIVEALNSLKESEKAVAIPIIIAGTLNSLQSI